MTIDLEELLALHNRLSPSDFQATMEMLVSFRDQNSALFNDADWSPEKIRHPFLAWLQVSLKKNSAKNLKNDDWITFPRPSDF